MNVGVLRTIDGFNHWKKAIAVLLVLLLAVAGAGVYFQLNPPTETTEVTKQKSPVEVNSVVTAYVNTDTAIHDEGERISGSSLYLRDEMPSPRIRSTVSSETKIRRVEQRMRLRLRATYEGTEYWSRTVAEWNETAQSDSRQVKMQTRPVNIDALHRRATRVRKAYNGQGTINSVLVLETVAVTTDGERVNLTQRFPVQVGAETYSIGNGRATSTGETSTKVSVTSRNAGKYTVSLIGAAATILLGIVGCAIAVRLRDPSRTEWDYQRNQFDEWISNGSVDASPTHTVEMESIRDIVDVAVDSERRVIYDERQQTCFLVVDDTLYYTTHPESTWEEA